jgi:hypothetical protein
MEEVNTFAEPILEAIAGRTPNVQDSGDTPRSWMKTERDEPFIEYVNGEMVASGPFSWTMWYTDFVIEMDYRFIDPSGTRWMFHARGYQVQFAFYDGGEVHVNELTDFPNAAKPGGSVNHVLIIVEDGVALFVNDQPKYYEELQGWKNGEAEWWIERWGELKGSVAFDNIKIWNLNDLKDLP